MPSSESDEFEVIDQLEASLSPEELAKVQAWLQPTDYEAQSSEFHRHLSSQAPGTGLWICETSKYHQWLNSNHHGSLWIKGVPGAGKSVTAASMIEHLRKTKGIPVLYFFFRYIISANRRPRSLIRDFLAQLLPYSARLQATLQPLLGTGLEDFSDEVLWEHLLIGLSSIEKVYCIVDALDEMELFPNDGFLNRLNNLATFRPNAVKLVMASRPKQYLQSSFRDASIVHISLEDDLVGKDISIFLSYRLKNLIPYDNQQRLRESLVSTIAERSRGLFLYARLLLDQIIPSLGSTQPDIERLVEILPVGLEEMYNSMLLQQAISLKIDTQIQVFLLELATHSSRALRLNEMASALASTFPPLMIPDAPKVVARTACAPLLEILEDETVQVIHHSFTEFLLNGKRTHVDTYSHTPQFPVLEPEKVHRKLTVICLDYLKSGGLRVGEAVAQRERDEVSAYDFDVDATSDNYDKEVHRYNYQEAKLRHPFLEYAVGNWAFHASNYDFEDDDFFQSVAGFLDPNSIDFRQWLELEWAKGLEQSEFQAPTPLHIAAFAGLTKYATKLIEGEMSVDPRDAEDRTPLHWACARGHTSMALLLLKSGAIPNPEDCRGVKPIHEAARKNHASIVRMLLEAGIDPLTPKTHENQKRRFRYGEVSAKGETAVEYVYLQGHIDTIMVMLPFLTPEALEEMFCQCCRYGKFEAARVILKASSLSPNSNSSGATALYLACRAHSVGIVELLLAKGADVHQTSEWRVKSRKAYGRRWHEPLRAPIHAAVLGWKSVNNIACQQILHLLLSAGADIEAKDAKGDTPLLSLFSEDNSSDIVAVEGLLQAGANVLAVDKKGDSVLHRSLSGPRHAQILKLLFEYGARADSLGKDGDTIMHTALKTYYLNGKSQCINDVINLLLEMGARCDVKNKQGSTAVEEAASNPHCSLETFTVLLQACSDPDALKRCVWKLTSRNKMDEAVNFIRVLQRFGVSLEDRDSDGRTVLLASAGCKELFAAFVKCGADLNAVDSKGRGVLYHFLSECHSYLDGGSLRRLVDMIDMGLDPMQVSQDGNNLLHVLAKGYTGKEIEKLFVQKLLEYGISINSKNNQGMTPLHVHLENWDFHKPRNTVNRRLDERFHERFEMPLLKIFQRSQESVDINSQDDDGVTIFHLASLHSEALLFQLLEEGADPGILTKKGRNALHLACRARQSNVVGYLCESQAYKTMINQRDSFGRTPLHDACTSGRLESVHYLLKAGADITMVDNNCRTSLHACAEFSDEQKTWTLLSRRNEVSGHLLRDRFRPARQISPLFDAPCYAPRLPTIAATGQDGPSIGLVVQSLLLAGSDAIAFDSFHQTPLDLAIEYDCQEMVRALQFTAETVQKGWKIEPEDRRLQTVIALKSSSLSIMALQEPSRQEIFQNPSTYLSFLTSDDVEWMAKNGGNVTGFDAATTTPSSGQSLLYVATSQGFTQLVESFGPLARVNDDPKIVLARIHELYGDSKYNPAIEYFAPTLHVACARELSNMDMLEVLVDKCGVDLNARALVKPQQWTKIQEFIEGGTALHIVAKANHWWQLHAVKYLLQRGAKIDSINEKGETPLHIACTGPMYADMNCTDNVYGFWRIECVKTLLDQGANFNILDNDGLSCLHKASSSPQIMRILLENGADLNAGKFSPLFSAIQIQCLETLTILLNAGVSPNAVDHNTDAEGFQLHYLVKEKAHSALFCTSFARLYNQQSENSASMVKLLIERGASLYAPLDDREILIHYTFEHAEYEILSAFLECAHKIDFNTRDKLGCTVFLAACKWRECLPGYRFRHWQAKETAPFLRTLEFDANPLVVDKEGRNALHHLLDNLEMEEEAIIQFLAHDAAKTLLHQKDRNGFTPLNCALRFLRPAVVEVLVTMSADLLSPDPTGSTALHHIAAQCLGVHSQSRTRRFGHEHKPEFYTGLLALWKKFLALGGSINVRDNKGSPPLFSYLSSSQRVNYKTPEESCCHLENFTTYFSEEITKDLDFRVKNGTGENALHIIARREKKDSTRTHLNHDKQLYEFFVGRGLDPLEEDGKGRSSLDIAAACEQKGILELFQYGK